MHFRESFLLVIFKSNANVINLNKRMKKLNNQLSLVFINHSFRSKEFIMKSRSCQYS